MRTSRLQNALHCLRKATLYRDRDAQSDAELLGLFVEYNDEEAFATLVRRHSSLVWGICSRTIAHHQDAEDAFQAVFLVLARKAVSIRQRDLLANWLYGVTHRTALHAKSLTIKRRKRETDMAHAPEPAARESGVWQSLEPLIDKELAELPEKYRVAVLLCDLQGKTGKEAARQLKLPEGTLASRLRTARVLLAKRLARHGITVSGGALATLLSQQAMWAQAPAVLLSATIKAASLYAMKQTSAPALVSAGAAYLIERMLKAMLISKLKTLSVVPLLLGLIAMGAGALHQTEASVQAVPAASLPKPPERSITVPAVAQHDAPRTKKDGPPKVIRYPVADLVIPINGLDFSAVLDGKIGAATKEDWLIQKIMQTVAPKSWNIRGGEGTLQYYPRDHSLVVHNSARVQSQVRYLLETMRRFQDVQVVTETRIVALRAAGFLELQRLLPRMKEKGAVLSELEAFAVSRKIEGEVSAKIIQLPKVTLFPGQQAQLQVKHLAGVNGIDRCDMKLRAFVGSNLTLMRFDAEAKLGGLNFNHKTQLQDGETLVQYQRHREEYVVLFVTPRVVLNVE